MKKNLQIIGSEPKEDKNKKAYRRINTNAGWHSCFNSVACAELKLLDGQTVCCEVTENDGTNFKGEPMVYKNIVKVIGQADLEQPEGQPKTFDEAEVPVVKPGMSATEYHDREQAKKDGRVPSRNTASMYTSYAKDIFVAILNNRLDKTKPLNADIEMESAINLVKQAKEAFE